VHPIAKDTTSATTACCELLGALGYTPRVPFREGLEATVRWYTDHRAWWELLDGHFPKNPTVLAEEGILLVCLLSVRRKRHGLAIPTVFNQWWKP
jgi:hypothetical protein